VKLAGRQGFKNKFYPESSTMVCAILFVWTHGVMVTSNQASVRVDRKVSNTTAVAAHCNLTSVPPGYRLFAPIFRFMPAPAGRPLPDFSPSANRSGI
jgi:hypothetical protein